MFGSAWASCHGICRCCEELLSPASFVELLFGSNPVTKDEGMALMLMQRGSVEGCTQLPGYKNTRIPWLQPARRICFGIQATELPFGMGQQRCTYRYLVASAQPFPRWHCTEILVSWWGRLAIGKLYSPVS